MTETDATTGADVLATTDAWGVFTHGTKCLAGYLRRLQRADCVRAACQRGRRRRRVGHCRWRFRAGYGDLRFAMQTAIAKAKQQGIAYVGVRNSCHFGAAGYYTWLAAREGLIGISMANDIPLGCGTGSRGAITGSNPISYAVRRAFPSNVARHVHRHGGRRKSLRGADAGRTNPRHLAGRRGWKTPPTRAATRKPARCNPPPAIKAMASRSLSKPLSGILTGAGFTWRVGNWMWDDGKQPTNHGAAFIAIDINAIMPAPNSPAAWKH